MPFALRIQRVETKGEEVLIVGELESGCYLGPEEIAVPLKGGRHLKAVVTTMGATNPKGWPVLPEHRSTLTLGLDERIAPSEIGIGELATSLGFSVPPEDSFRDANELLKEPLFWPAHYQQHLANRDSGEEPGQLIPRFFGNSYAQTTDFFLRHLGDQKIFPRFTKHVSDTSFVEISYVEPVEFQIRFSIGSLGEKPVMLGYESGHFSLPAFRWEEVDQVCRSHRAIEGNHSAAECLLLLLPAIYIGREDSRDAIYRSVVDAWQELGVVRADVEDLAQNIINNLTMENHKWSQQSKYGWISNNPHSQRNPESEISVVTEAGWAKISSFFSTI